MQGTNVTTYKRNNPGQLLSETHDGINVTNAYDALFRRKAISLSSDASLWQAYSNYFGYDAASRLSGVTNNYGANLSSIYSYLPGASLVQSVTHRADSTVRLLTIRSYDQLDWVKTLIHSNASGVASSFTYGYNLAQQRTNVTVTRSTSG